MTQSAKKLAVIKRGPATNLKLDYKMIIKLIYKHQTLKLYTLVSLKIYTFSLTTLS